ncbi:hypothetical protein O7626_01860 [Micromonospora sp. WMMD1102]|nr:hypothetical protein [Micromonospora sp. WMMD1102]MDG4784687.1 hypothetical protein [Micromonospora sp. WMMD1102]
MPARAERAAGDSCRRRPRQTEEDSMAKKARKKKARKKSSANHGKRPNS